MLKEDNSVHGSDEEVDEEAEAGSDEELSDDGDRQLYEEIGSVDEESTKTDDEYDDLAMQDVQENGYWLGSDDRGANHKIFPVPEDQSAHKEGDKYRQNLDLFHRTRSESFSEPLCPYSSLFIEKNELPIPCSGNMKFRKRRSLSIPALGRHGSLVGGPILSGAPQC
ncbi:hypothetical protein D8674_021219 [Pyrus ussuriensis x Pyrus communis]|uniref:Uncharacterized protein n=1 Tax=Pyrus ussuriensis x Pyrus communis TaxID=2448454 RepID=A0A5N5GLA8_9ROSA|nr:hypothetical protein D8674_021219 [Pyrus ussuriensis x Pyrus communis]